MVKIIEIDDNNNSNVFNDTSFESVSVTTKHGKDTFRKAIFEQMVDESNYIIIDAGGGNDSKMVLETLAKEGSSDDFLYVIPVTNSLSQAKNAIDTFSLINKPEQTLFVLNQVHESAEEEFLFWFGNDELGIESVEEQLGQKVNFVILKRSPIFELAASNGFTIEQLAEIARAIETKDTNKLFFEQSNGDMQTWQKLKNQYEQSQMADEYLIENLDALKQAVSGFRNVAVVSTKGGVGKSTLSWHLLPLCIG
jgi:MinD-like ATPase involved in chromosome partitioning or flagellar assembly